MASDRKLTLEEQIAKQYKLGKEDAASTARAYALFRQDLKNEEAKRGMQPSSVRTKVHYAFEAAIHAQNLNNNLRGLSGGVARVVRQTKDGKSDKEVELTFDSFTDLFLEEADTRLSKEEFHLGRFLTPHKILQLGASAGRFLKRWQKYAGIGTVMGYDFDQRAIDEMKSNGVPCKKINLNSMNDTGEKLTYEKELAKDLNNNGNPVNILLIRVLCYLQEEARILLMFSLMNLSPPGSTLIIVDPSLDAPGERLNMETGYAASFFMRSDFETLHHKMVVNSDTINGVAVGGNHTDETLVVRKIGPRTS